MRIAVLGLWHLGVVTAACAASLGHDVVGLDDDSQIVAALNDGRAPLAEPGLDELIGRQRGAGRLRFDARWDDALGDAEVLWVAYDTPIDADDRANVEYVRERVRRALPLLAVNSLVIVSSQVPIGTTRGFEVWARQHLAGRNLRFAHAPENLRLGSALDVFLRPDRVVIGIQCQDDRPQLATLFSFAPRIEWMSIASAEMTKHALNAFLATSVSFANEIAALCELTGADGQEVARGLQSDARIGGQAYVKPGPPFAGGTLARDLRFLQSVGADNHLRLPVLAAVSESNRAHADWPLRRLQERLGSLAGRTIAVLGLAYKPGTSALRRSWSIEICAALAAAGASVKAYDPAVTALPGSPSVRLAGSSLDALSECDAVLVATPWPEFRALDPSDLVARMRTPLVLDPFGLLQGTISGDDRISYLTVGQPSSASRRPS